MSEQNQTDRDNEKSFDEMFRTLLRHWGKIVLFSLVVTAAAGGYLAVRPGTHEARLYVDESQYEILYDVDHPLARQHLLLAQSPAFLTQVSERMAEAGLREDRDGNDTQVFAVQVQPTRTLLISARMPTPGNAVAALTLWAEEYRKFARVCRARKLLRDQQKSLQSGAVSHAQMEDLLQRCRQKQQARASSNEPWDELAARAVSNKIVELESGLLTFDLNADLARELSLVLTPLAAKDVFVVDGNTTTNSTEAVKRYAASLLDNNLNSVCDAPEVTTKRMSILAKIVVAFLLGIGLSSAAVLMVEGFRGR